MLLTYTKLFKIYSDTPALDYKMPYEDEVNSDPEISEMKNIVCDLKLRPGNNDWPKNTVT